MKTVSNSLLLLFAILLASTLGGGGTARAQRAPGKTTPPPSPPPATPSQPAPLQARPIEDKLAPVGWTRYAVGTPVRFSLILPGEPSGSTERMNLTPQIAVTVRTYMSVGETGLYGATYIDDLPSDLMDEGVKRTFFEGFVNGFAEGFQAGMNKAGVTEQIKMTETRAATAGGLAGYEQDFTFDKMTGRVRLVFDGARAYAVMSFWSDAASGDDRAAFFGSLRVSKTR